MFYSFIEIGTSDFRLVCEKNTSRGIAVEPILCYLNRLPHRDNLILVQAAISNFNGTTEIHYLPPEIIRRHKLPWYLRGTNMVGKIHPMVAHHLIARNLPISLVETTVVPTMTLTALMSTYEVSWVDLLKLDTEGHDYIILNEYLTNTSIFAIDIKFESNKWTPPEELQKTIQLAESKGYKLISTGYDTHLRYKG